MTVFKRWTGTLNDMPPLHWTDDLDEGSLMLNKMAASQGGTAVAIVTCASGHACALRTPRPHTISRDGVMQPSLACPVPGCSGHEAPGSVLEGWGRL